MPRRPLVACLSLPLSFVEKSSSAASTPWKTLASAFAIGRKTLSRPAIAMTCRFRLLASLSLSLCGAHCLPASLSWLFRCTSYNDCCKDIEQVVCLEAGTIATSRRLERFRFSVYILHILFFFGGGKLKKGLVLSCDSLSSVV